MNFYRPRIQYSFPEYLCGNSWRRLFEVQSEQYNFGSSDEYKKTPHDRIAKQLNASLPHRHHVKKSLRGDAGGLTNVYY